MISPRNMPQVSSRGFPEVFTSPTEHASAKKQSKLQEARTRYKEQVNRGSFEDIHKVISGILGSNKKHVQYDESYSLESTGHMPQFREALN